MHGALLLPLAKRSRTRLAPTPTNISTNSEPEILKNGTPASPATARARSVLPVPGVRPTPRRAESVRPARPTFGFLQKLNDLAQVLEWFIDARDVTERDSRLRPVSDARATG